MKEFIRKMLKESLTVPYFRLVKDVQITPEEMVSLKGINWRDITLNDLGGDGNIAYIGVDVGSEAINRGIVVDIQVLHDMFYQVHTHLAKELQGIGLGAKILKAFIMEYGHIYAGKGRTLNQDANKMLSKLTTDSDLESYSDEYGLLILKKGNEDKEQLLQIIQN